MWEWRRWSLGLFLGGLALPSCSSGENDEPSNAYRCSEEYNACYCGDPAQIVLRGAVINACPGPVPQGPFRCCQSADRCRCVPYVCIGGASSECLCQYTVNPVRPSRCLTSAQQASEQSTDPGAGVRCCAKLAADAGQCRCTKSECEVSEQEVSVCSVETTNPGCLPGETEVTSCSR